MGLEDFEELLKANVDICTYVYIYIYIQYAYTFLHTFRRYACIDMHFNMRILAWALRSIFYNGICRVTCRILVWAVVAMKYQNRAV